MTHCVKFVRSLLGHSPYTIIYKKIYITKTIQFQWIRMKRSNDENVMPLKLGITGGVGSGKSFVCNYLKEKGLRVVSADELARNAVLPGTPAYNKVVEYFGKDILSDDRTLNRKKLREVITQDKQKKEMLEKIIHPEVFSQMDLAFEKSVRSHDPAIAFEVPLLFETGMEFFFDYVLTIFVNSDVRVARIMARDQITQKQATSLMKIQMPEEEKIKKSDFIIDNNGTLKETQILIDHFYENFISKIKN